MLIASSFEWMEKWKGNGGENGDLATKLELKN
jgi:hypothetical protein